MDQKYRIIVETNETKAIYEVDGYVRAQLLYDAFSESSLGQRVVWEELVDQRIPRWKVVAFVTK